MILRGGTFALIIFSLVEKMFFQKAGVVSVQEAILLDRLVNGSQLVHQVVHVVNAGLKAD